MQPGGASPTGILYVHAFFFQGGVGNDIFDGLGREGNAT